MPDATRHHHAITLPTLAILAGSVTALAGTLALRVLIARALSPAELGVLFLAVAIVSSTGGVASLGLNPAAAQRLALLSARGDREGMHRTSRTAMVTAAGAGALTALTIVAAAWLVVPHLKDGAQLGAVLLVLAPVALGMSLGLAMVGVSRGFENVTGRALIRDAGGGVLRLGAVAVAVATGGSLAGIALGFAAGAVTAELSLVVYGVACGWLGKPVAVGWDRELLRGLPPFTLMEALSQLTQWMDMVILGVVAPPAAVGFYTVARGLSRALQMVHLSASHSFLPAATAAAESGGAEPFLRTYTRTRVLIFALFWPLLAPCLLAPLAVITLLYGDSYAPAAPVLLALALAFTVEAAFGYKDLSLIAVGRAREVSHISVASTAVGLALMFALTPTLHGAGAALALLVMSATRGTSLAWKLWRERGVALRHDAPIPVVIAVVATLAASLGTAAVPARWAQVALVAGTAGLASLAILAHLRATR